MLKLINQRFNSNPHLRPLKYVLEYKQSLLLWWIPWMSYENEEWIIKLCIYHVAIWLEQSTFFPFYSDYLMSQSVVSSNAKLGKWIDSNGPHWISSESILSSHVPFVRSTSSALLLEHFLLLSELRMCLLCTKINLLVPWCICSYFVIIKNALKGWNVIVTHTFTW